MALSVHATSPPRGAQGQTGPQLHGFQQAVDHVRVREVWELCAGMLGRRGLAITIHVSLGPNVSNFSYAPNSATHTVANEPRFNRAAPGTAVRVILASKSSVLAKVPAM